MSRKSKLSPEEFVKAWQKAKTAEDAAKVAGTSLMSTRQRASLYRRKGVALKKFPSLHTGNPLDIAELSKLARSTAPKTVAAKSSKKTTKKPAKRKRPPKKSKKVAEATAPKAD